MAGKAAEPRAGDPPRDDGWVGIAFSFVRRLSPVPKSSPDHRVLVKGPRGTAVLGVPALDAKWKAKGPRGTTVLGLARPPALPAAPEQEISPAQTFSRPMPRQHGGRVLWTVVATSFGVLLAFGIGGYGLVTVLERFAPERARADAASPAQEPAPAATLDRAPAEPARVEATASAAPAIPAADAAAIATLEALRAAVERCRADIRAFPGTSPAVPSSVAALRAGPYQPTASDFRSPFFRCTDFRVDGPMPYVLQWQFHRSTNEGQGIAWIDDQGDGVADRAYAFTVKASASGATYGPVVPVSPATVVKRR